MTTLDTSYGWVAGDVERIIIALDLGIGRFTIEQVTVDCNQLGEMSPTLVERVRGLLSEYEEANTIQKDLGVGADSGRVLVKADVLEWQVDPGGKYEALFKEKGRITDELVKIFAFSPIISRFSARNSASLVRS